MGELRSVCLGQQIKQDWLVKELSKGLGHVNLQQENHSTDTHPRFLPDPLGKELLGEKGRNSPAVVS